MTAGLATIEANLKSPKAEYTRAPMALAKALARDSSTSLRNRRL
jgi:hypothetical protein